MDAAPESITSPPKADKFMSTLRGTKALPWLAGGGILLLCFLLQHTLLSPGVALLNLWPGAMFVACWCAWLGSRRADGLRTLVLMATGIVLLRPHLLFASGLWPLSWGAAIFLAAVVVWQLFRYCRTSAPGWLFPLLVSVILFNASGHASWRSIYTCAPDPISGFYYGTPYGGVLVNADLPHYYASEKIFTEPGFDPSFSVLLRRYFYGYLTSLLSTAGFEWIGPFLLNLVFWLAAAINTLRLALRLGFERKIAAASAIAACSGFGLTVMSGQPAMYAAAYAAGAICLGLIMELEAREINWLPPALIIAAANGIYDIYQITAACAVFLLVRRRFGRGLFVLATTLACTPIWNLVFLHGVLGHTGNPLNSDLISKSIQEWIRVAVAQDWPAAGSYIVLAGKSWWYSGFGVGALTAVVFGVVQFLRRKHPGGMNGRALILFGHVWTLNFLSTLATAPGIRAWSPGGVLPRISHYSYPVDMIAQSQLAGLIHPFAAFVTPVTHFTIANADLFGIATPGRTFLYGWSGPPSANDTPPADAAPPSAKE